MLTREQQVWVDGEPVLGLLPNKGYQDNEVVAAVLGAVDDKLTQWQQLLATFHETLDPATCPDGYLDYVAFLFGLSFSPYWDGSWSPSTKRAILAVQAWLRRYRGTVAAIKKVLGIQGVTFSYWQDSALVLPFPLPSVIGTARQKLYVLLPKTVGRTNREWRETVRTVKGYCPATTESVVAYMGFILGQSQFGEPVFPAGTKFLVEQPNGTQYLETI